MELLETSRKKIGSCVGSLKSLVQKIVSSSYEAVILITSEHQNSSIKMETTTEEPFSEEFVNWRAAVAQRKPMVTTNSVTQTGACSSNNYSVPPYNSEDVISFIDYSNGHTVTLDRDNVEFLPLFRMSGKASTAYKDNQTPYPKVAQTPNRKKPPRHKQEKSGPAHRISPNAIATGIARTPAAIDTAIIGEEHLWAKLIDNTQKQIEATRNVTKTLG